MTRRSSRKSEIVPSYAEIDEDSNPKEVVKVEERTPTKKVRNAPHEERVGVVEKSIPNTSLYIREKAQADIIDRNTIETVKIVKIESTPKKRKAQAGAVKSDETNKKTILTPTLTPKKQTTNKADRTTKRKAETDEVAQEVADVKSTKKRKTKEEKEAEAMPLAARTPITSLKRAMYIGAHVSGAGGVQNSINNAIQIGGNAFALFLKSQRKWVSPPLANEAKDMFQTYSIEHKYDQSKHVLPHGSYLVNLAQAEPEKADQAYDCFLDDLKRCEALGIGLYNFHPGNTGPHPRPQAIARIAANLNRAHKATKSVITLLENMAGSGNVIGSTFEDLRDIIELIDDKSRIGVCIDTCHSFAAGYDLRTAEAFKKTMGNFSEIVGIKYLKALHLNDSKAPFSSHRDLHANIGTGFLGLRAFHNVVNYEPFQELPMVLETPIDKKGEDGKVIEDKGVWATEIKLLEGLIGADPESDEFKADEQRLWDAGAEERAKFQKQADKKVQKTLDSMFKPVKGKIKKKNEVDRDAGDSDSDGEGHCSH